MKNKIFYWCPFIDNVGTVKSVLNSAICVQKYNKQNYEVVLLNVFGEWEPYLNKIKQNNIELLEFNFKYKNLIFNKGFIQSRLSYLLIFFMSFFDLKKKIQDHQPKYFIAHLLTSLPLIIFSLFKFNTKLILRISGFPRLNFFRKNLWKFCEKKIFKVTCPTEELYKNLKLKKVFSDSILHVLKDAVFLASDFQKKKISEYRSFDFKKYNLDNYFVSVGRLTNQKNHKYLITEFKKFNNKNDNYKLLIIGDGEKKKELVNLVKKLDLENSVYFTGFLKNPFYMIKKSVCLISSSLWEELGFVLVEASMLNVFIIASNCPNGPSEYIGNNKRGIIFESNKKDALLIALNQFVKIKDNYSKIKKESKLKAKEYSGYQHFKKFEDIILK